MSQPWNEPERSITPESVFLNRRSLLRGLGLAGGIGLAGMGALYLLSDLTSDEQVLARGDYATPPGRDLYPAPVAVDHADAGRPITPEAVAARWCNFFEFTDSKAVHRHVADFNPVPWLLEVSGLVRKPLQISVDDLVRHFPLEERIYRHRCVETWAMVVPWTGFTLARLLETVEPLDTARFVRFVSLDRPRSGWVEGNYPWPYTEGLTLAEARNPLTFLATGLYGRPLRKQHGAPVRLVVPWKYGFKSAKSLVRIEVTAERPGTFWNTLLPHEYGFEANVEPDVPHPRWSQSTERMLGTGERFPTRLYNGYGKWVADLY